MTDQPVVARKKPGRKPKIVVAARAASVDLNTVIAKRLSGDPFAAGQIAIPLRDPHLWDTYVASSEVNPNRHYDMVNRKGWVPTTIYDLPDGISPESIGWQVAEDGQTLCRGPRGQEIVYKMPKDVRNQIQEKKTALNRRGMGSAAKVKTNMANALGNTLGSEAGDFAHQNITVTGGDRVGPLGS